jgi:GNAT superfamily N-acetyltransferase
VLTRLRRYLRKHGVRQTAVEGVRRLTYRRQRFIVMVKDLSSIAVPWRAGDLHVEDLQAKHLPGLFELNRKRDRRDVDRRFVRYVEQGFNGFVAYRGDELVGYYWWVDRDAPTLFPDLRDGWQGIELADGDAYGSDFFLLEEHRGGGVAPDFLFQIESSLHDRGYARVWGFVDYTARPARWLYSTRGYVGMWAVQKTRVLMISRTKREAL